MVEDYVKGVAWYYFNQCRLKIMSGTTKQHTIWTPSSHRKNVGVWRKIREEIPGGPTSHWWNWVESVMHWQHFSRAPVPSVQYSLTPWEEKLNWKPPKRKCLWYRVVECITRNIKLTKVRQCFNLTEVFLPLSNLDGLICLNTFFSFFVNVSLSRSKERR